MPTLTILPSGKTVETARGTLLRDALQSARVLLDYPCAGKGRCRQCRVMMNPAPAAGAEGLKQADREAGYRLACQVPVEVDCSVTIETARSSGQAWQQGLRGQDVDGKPFAGTIRRAAISLPAPGLEDQRADWERLEAGLASAGISAGIPDVASLEQVSSLLREHQWRVEAVCEENDLLCLRPPAGGRVVGFAVDLGTTTVDLALLDLETGEALARRAFLNGQVSFGADVISRAQSFHDDRRPVREAALRTIEEGAQQMLREAGIAARNVARTVVVGNPIMIHILHGIDPFQLTHVPYVPVIAGARRGAPRDFGWTFQRDGVVETLPLISAYVGADTVGMIVALGLEEEEATTLSIDIGTNGELVLARSGAMLATSTAAGPAFEGAQISCGMRALDGAITDVDIDADGELTLRVVGGGAARGVCGTGLVAGVAELLSRDVMDTTGRLAAPSEIATARLRERIFTQGTEPAFALTEDRAVYLSQSDIRTLQLAKGAVRTGIETLLEKSGLTADGLDELRLAGNFGAGLDAKAAMRIGLIPPMDLDKVRVVGNAALRGAVMVLLSRESWRLAQSAARNARFVELGGTAEFQEKFMDSMMF
jgi:uncharacterized 2Fe-2S/4Fe-4S cluster protein (DUF4445 family)